MSYRVLSSHPPKTQTRDQIRLYWEAAMIQCFMTSSNWEKIFIDEFHISNHRSKFKGWGFKYNKWSVTTPLDSFSLYFTLAVSEKHIYGIMASEKANTAQVFIHFLDQLLKCMKEKFSKGNKQFCFIIDNWSIHKTLDVKKFVEGKKIHVLTIPPYSPSLNGAETVINAIKSKVQQRRRSGK